MCEMRDHARELERENARLRELITLLEIAGEGMSEECASQPHIAKWDAARGEVGSFLRQPNVMMSDAPSGSVTRDG